MRSGKSASGFEIEMTGPLCLNAERPNLMTWLARAGACVVGSVKLLWEEKQVAVLCDLQVVGGKDDWQVTTKLVAAIAEYARERGILKLKVHRNSSHEWLGGLLSRLGFKDAATSKSTATPMQFYLDLYHSNRRRGREDTPVEQPASIRLAI